MYTCSDNMKRIFAYLLTISILFSLSAPRAGALETAQVEESSDTIHLSNGRSLRGIISKESAASVELQTSGGSVTINRAAIKKISRGSPEAIARLKDRWAEYQANIETQKEGLAEERQKRSKAYEEWVRENTAKKVRSDLDVNEIKLLKTEHSKDIMVEVLINDTVKASLILDTGSYDIVLTRRIGDALKVDFSDTKNNVVSIRLAGKVRLAKVVMLDALSIQNVKERGLPADVLFDDEDVLGLKDGLLGLAFLNRFESIIDLNKMKMRLQKKNDPGRTDGAKDIAGSGQR